MENATCSSVSHSILLFSLIYVHVHIYDFSSGIFGAVFMFFWARFAYDSPSKHPRISDKERIYIENSLPDSDATDQV